MREEFLGPLAGVHTAATLIFGKTRVACIIVEVTNNGFRVAVPGASRYEGDPKLTLMTRDAFYPVKLNLQEAHAGGYSYRLERTSVAARSSRKSHRALHWVWLTSRCCAVGLIAVIAASCFCVATTTDPVPMLSLRGIHKEVSGRWSPSVPLHDRAPHGIPVGSSLASNVVLPETVKRENSDPSTISVSMISPASLSIFAQGSSVPAVGRATPSIPHDEPLKGTAGRRIDGRSDWGLCQKTIRGTSFKSSLEAGRVGRIQTVHRSLVPWLFGSEEMDSNLSLRMSDAAWVDLKQFELGLKGLPHETSLNAIASLRKTLLLAISDDQNARSVPGMRDLFILSSADANVYFRRAQGWVELVRVLPIDTNQAEEK